MQEIITWSSHLQMMRRESEVFTNPNCMAGRIKLWDEWIVTRAKEHGRTQVREIM